jgi:hypothetical protein
MPTEQADKPVTAVKITSEVISKPGATLEVKVVTIPPVVKAGISLALNTSKKTSDKK